MKELSLKIHQARGNKRDMVCQFSPPLGRAPGERTQHYKRSYRVCRWEKRVPPRGHVCPGALLPFLGCAGLGGGVKSIRSRAAQCPSILQ